MTIERLDEVTGDWVPVASMTDMDWTAAGGGMVMVRLKPETEEAGEVTSTESGDLAAFLLARFAEDAAAIDEYGDGWAQGDKVYAPGRNPDLNSPWGPSRLLAECGAKRWIVELHSRKEGDQCATCGDDVGEAHGVPYVIGEPWPCPTLKLLALPYADHPDFREEWRP